MTMLLQAPQLGPVQPSLYLSLPAMTGHRLCCQGMRSPEPGDGHFQCLAVSAAQKHNAIQYQAQLHSSTAYVLTHTNIH